MSMETLFIPTPFGPYPISVNDRQRRQYDAWCWKFGDPLILNPLQMRNLMDKLYNGQLTI